MSLQNKEGKNESWNHCKNQVLVYYKINDVLKYNISALLQSQSHVWYVYKKVA